MVVAGAEPFQRGMLTCIKRDQPVIVINAMDSGPDSEYVTRHCLFEQHDRCSLMRIEGGLKFQPRHGNGCFNNRPIMKSWPQDLLQYSEEICQGGVCVNTTS